MKVINARNVNDALAQGIGLLLEQGVRREGRNGVTLEIPEPVTTVYERPWERVLLNPVRDANPFFHFFEALWILAGRDDVKFLTEFNKRMVDYSDDGVVFNAPYGYRLRHGILNAQHDQLARVIDILRGDPDSRQAVCQIWDEDDLYENTKDKACNMSIVFRIRNTPQCHPQLHMTVYNRSNDMLWGAYGANMVQFSTVQEYVARHLGIALGPYTQVSNSFHVYLDGPGGSLWDRLVTLNAPFVEYPDDTLVSMCQGNHPEQMIHFDNDLELFFKMYDMDGIDGILRTPNLGWQSGYFTALAIPMLTAFYQYGPGDNIGGAKSVHYIQADDWRLAVEQWYFNRGVKV